MTDGEFEQFVTQSQTRALQVAFGYLGDWEEARDAVQEAFVKAYCKLDTFRGDSAASTWFHRLLANHCKDRLRRRKVRSFLTLASSRPSHNEAGDETPDPLESYPDNRPNPEKQAHLTAMGREMQQAFDNLPPRQAELCRLHLSAGMTLKESAQTMGITEGAAKAHYFRAVRTLREKLNHWKEGP
jgi:RNA polymerase sigma-70 factor (ECF subfamily)